METEAHVYALAVAASTLLALYPFLMVMLAICRDVLHLPSVQQTLGIAIGDMFAGGTGQFIARNLQPWMVPRFHWVAMILLLITANGVFEPLEVALNRAWGVQTNRSYLKNQLISLGLIFACGTLALLSLWLTAINSDWIARVTGGRGGVETWLKLLFFKLAAVPVSMLALFLVYWLLPNRPVDPRRVAPVAIVVGLLMEAMKYVSILVSPWLAVKLTHEYQVFQHSVAILLWSFAAAIVVLAGAHWTARQDRADPLE